MEEGAPESNFSPEFPPSALHDTGAEGGSAGNVGNIGSAEPPASNVTSEECAVCFEVMSSACPVRKLSCGHQYHHGCIQQWLRRRASCPLCKAETETPAEDEAAAAVFRIDLGHQEMCRMVQDVEDIFLAVQQCVGPDHPVAISGIVFNLCVSLGYEDEDELEEAMGCTFVEFLTALPHFEVVWRPDLDVAAPEPRALMRPDMGEDGQSREARRIVLTISEREDLWRVALQGPQAIVEIPEIDFAIRPDSKRRIDTIYNMISAAVYNLGDHVRLNSRSDGGISDHDAVKICEAIDSLNRLLDLDQSFTFVLSDPQGISDLKPIQGAYIGPYVEEESAESRSAESM